MRNDGQNERINKKERNFSFGLLQHIENRFISRKGIENSAGIKITVKQCRIKYSKRRGFFEAI